MASTRNRKSQFQLDIQYYHNQWCMDNGYPVNSYKPQAGRPKAASVKRQAPSSDKNFSMSLNPDSLGSSFRPPATRSRIQEPS